MFNHRVMPGTTTVMLLAGVLAGGLPASGVDAQTVAPAGEPVVAAMAGAPSHYPPNRFSKRAGAYYGLIWGIDSLSVKAVESGDIIRFAYRVLNADKAGVLNDKKLEPALLAPRAQVQLVIPSMEKIGKLRQSSTPVEGKAYWMAFSNKGRLVRRGDRVSVVIGQFRADGLIVD